MWNSSAEIFEADVNQTQVGRNQGLGLSGYTQEAREANVSSELNLWGYDEKYGDFQSEFKDLDWILADTISTTGSGSTNGGH